MPSQATEFDQVALRSIIDAVAMIRAHSARLGFAALRAAADGPVVVDAAPIEAACAGVARGLDLVAGDAPMPDHAAANLAWLRAIAAGEPGLLDRFRAFDALAARLLGAARGGAVPMDLAHQVVMAGADDFYEASTRLMVLLWSDLETRRSESVAAARAAIEAAGQAFTDLSDRAAEAHMLALHARIEAARADQAAFGVIAEELSALADGISVMAKGAGQTLDDAQSRL